jgi:hypothetical protein
VRTLLWESTQPLKNPPIKRLFKKKKKEKALSAKGLE